MANGDDIRLHYTIDDDGIWLECTRCEPGTDEMLGFFPTADEVVSAVRRHRREVHGEGTFLSGLAPQDVHAAVLGELIEVAPERWENASAELFMVAQRIVNVVRSWDGAS